MVQGAYGWQRWGIALLIVFLSLSPVTAADTKTPPAMAVEARPLVLGILPFISSIALLKRFAPLRDYLSEQTGRPVLLETARDYPEFVRRTTKRRYDVVITAPHFVALALDSDAYTVQATYADRLAAVVVVPAGSDIDDPSDLTGRSVATPPDQAIVTWVGTALIQRHSDNGTNPQYRAYQSHNAAYSAAAAGEVSAAVVSISLIDSAKLANDGLRELIRSQTFPAMGILMAADLAPALRAQLTSTLVEMSESTRGRAVLKRISYAGYRRSDAAEFDSMREYLPRLRQLLEPQT